MAHGHFGYSSLLKNTAQAAVSRPTDFWLMDVFETSCAVGAPLRMKKGRIEVATFQRKDDQQYTASERVVETVPRCLDEPLPVA
jgi:hypothetical protein